MERYNACQKMKNRIEAPGKNLMMNEVPKKPWTYLTVESITRLPLVSGKDAILVVCD